MKPFSISFEQPLTAACIRKDEDAAALAQKTREDALQTLERLGGEIARVEATIERQFEMLRDELTTTAIEIARTVLHSEKELIDDQVREFVKVGIESLSDASSSVSAIKAVCVHPDCVPTVSDWIAESDLKQYEIVPDASVPVGDCRIDAGDTGALVSLESLLSVIAIHLTKKEASQTPPTAPGVTQ